MATSNGGTAADAGGTQTPTPTPTPQTPPADAGGDGGTGKNPPPAPDSDEFRKVVGQRDELKTKLRDQGKEIEQLKAQLGQITDDKNRADGNVEALIASRDEQISTLRTERDTLAKEADALRQDNHLTKVAGHMVGELAEGVTQFEVETVVDRLLTTEKVKLSEDPAADAKAVLKAITEVAPRLVRQPGSPSGGAGDRPGKTSAGASLAAAIGPRLANSALFGGGGKQ